MKVLIDTKDLQKILSNVGSYGDAFVRTIESQRASLNFKIGTLVIELLGEHIDSQARLHPSRLHHVYEPGMVGDPKGRLFEFSMAPTVDAIFITGRFLESKGVPENGTEPFREKAEVMESGMSVEIVPKDSGVLVFEDDGETVFTSAEVFVEHPGGPEVEQAFGDTVYEFLELYVTRAVIWPLLQEMGRSDAFDRNFGLAGKSGAAGGRRAGMDFMGL